MRLGMVLTALLAACSSAPLPDKAGANTIAAVPAPAGNAAAAAETQPAAPVAETQAIFMARCRQDYLRLNPGGAADADGTCGWNWTTAQASGALVDAVLALAPASPGAALNLADARSAAGRVRWRARNDAAQALAEGELAGRSGADPLHVVLNGRADAVRAVSFSLEYGAENSGNTYALIEGLRVRGYRVTRIGCPLYAQSSSGSGEVARVDAPGKAPFVVAEYLTVPETGGATGYQGLIAYFSDTIPDLAALRSGRWAGASDAESAWSGEAPAGWSADCTSPG